MYRKPMIINKWHFRVLFIIIIIACLSIVPCQHTIAQSQQEPINQNYSSIASVDLITKIVKINTPGIQKTVDTGSGGDTIFGEGNKFAADPDTLAASKKRGTIIINPEPDEINAPWSITGPNNYSNKGAGDQILAKLNPGNYTLTWGAVNGWVTPSPNPETQYLAGGDSIKYTGKYSKIPEPPSVTTDQPADITARNATLSGNLTGLGGYISTDVSFEWGTTPGVLNNTTPAQTKTIPGVFTDKIINLLPGTTYYFRAKAASGDATVYGDELSFSTLKELASILITPENPAIDKGLSQQFSATGIYSDLSLEDITASVAWSSNNTAVATIGEDTGLASGVEEGQAMISAVSGNVTGKTLLTVTPLKELYITITGSGNTTPPVGIHIYSSNTNVTLSAVPSGGWAFENWTGDVSDNTSSNTTVTMDSDKAVTANFVRVSATLTLAVSGGGSTNPSTGNHTCAIGATIEIEAIPAAGYMFVSWTGDTATVVDVSSAATTILIDDDYALTANFAEIQPDGDDDEGNDDSSGGGTTGGTSGGGGGGGGANGKTITSLRYSSSSTGVVWANIKATSMDARTILDIPYGTKCTNANGNALTSVTITEIAGPDAAQTGITVIGKVYELGPAGAGFDPPITLTIKYNEASLPAGTPESSLGIAFLGGEGGTYEIIDCLVDTEANKITAFISHFSQYAIISVPRPAEFVLSGLSVSPASVKQGEAANIGVTVSNTGDASGNYEISLVIDGITEQTGSGSLSGGASETVSFSITTDVPGEHTISIGDLSGIFTVEIPDTNTPEATVKFPEPTVLPIPDIVEESAPPTEPAYTQPEKETQAPENTSPVAALPLEKSSLFWRIIACNVAGFIIILGLLVFTIFSRKRS